jgi:hypothetical protein
VWLEILAFLAHALDQHVDQEDLIIQFLLEHFLGGRALYLHYWLTRVFFKIDAV